MLSVFLYLWSLSSFIHEAGSLTEHEDGCLGWLVGELLPSAGLQLPMLALSFRASSFKMTCSHSLLPLLLEMSFPWGKWEVFLGESLLKFGAQIIIITIRQVIIRY